MSLVGLADDIWSEVILSHEENLAESVVIQLMFVILVEQSEIMENNLMFRVEGCYCG